MGKNRYIFESGHIVPSLGAWYGVITVCAGSFHSGEHFWCFSTSGITWGCAFGVSAFIDPIFILGHFLFSWCNCWKLSWLDFFIGIWLVSSIGFPMGMDPLYVPLEFIYWWIVALIGMNFNLGLLLVHLLEFLLVYPTDWHPQRYCWVGRLLFQISLLGISMLFCVHLLFWLVGWQVMYYVVQ